MTDHTHAWGSDEPCTPLADDVCLWPERDSDGVIRAYWVSHDNPRSDANRCVGRVPIGLSSHPTWEATGSLADGTLTLRPSILEPASASCDGQHGWVTEGRWVPA